METLLLARFSKAFREIYAEKPDLGCREIFFGPPNHHSGAIEKMTGINVVRMQWYETRFKQSLLPDEVVLKKNGYKLTIPEKWKNMQ